MRPLRHHYCSYRETTRFFIGLLVFTIVMSMFLERAVAQSFWEHKSVFNGGMAIAASDSEDFVFTSGGFDPARTQDYGEIWKSIFVDSPRIAHNIKGLVHPSRNLIILGCDDVQTEVKPNGFLDIAEGVIIRSTDGGSTWTDTTIGSSDTAKPHNPIGTIAALDSNHIFIPIGGDHYLISSDGGASWQSIPCPVSRHYAIANPAVPLINPVAAYPAPNTLVVAEVDSAYPFANYPCKIFRSTNLGMTWSNGFQTSDNIMKFAFVSPVVGFAAGYVVDASTFNETAVIDKTTDGGITWFNIYTQRFPDAVGFQSIAFADSLNGIAVGFDGLILRTTDAGMNWVRENSDITEGDPASLLDVAFPTRSKAIIADGNGAILIYRPDTLLDMPNITYPQAIGPGNISVDSNFDATWDPVPGATRYAIWVQYQGGTNPIVLSDSNVNTTSYHLAGFDTIPEPLVNLSQYALFVQAFSSNRKSNVAERVFRVPTPPSSVSDIPGGPVGQYLYVQNYPNPAASLFHCRLNGIYANPGGELTAEMDDMLGRKIMDLTTLARAGNNGHYSDFLVDVSSLPSGIYRIRYTLDEYSQAGDVVIIH